MFVKKYNFIFICREKMNTKLCLLPSLKLMIKIFVFVLVHTVVQEKRERIAKKFGKMR